MLSATLSLGFACIATVLAAPAPQSYTANSSSFDSSVAIGDLTIEQVTKAAPKAICEGAEYPLECSTAVRAQPFLNEAFTEFGLTTLGQKAAVLSLMVFESGDFVYNVNHHPDPGRPGQGTKCMMMFWNILDFAKYFPTTAPGIETLNNGGLWVNADNFTSVSNSTQKAILGLVTPVQYTFKAAPWYLTHANDCPRDAITRLSTDGFKGFQYYTEKCVDAGTLAAAPERIDSWCFVLKALLPEGTAAPEECNDTKAAAEASASNTF